MYFDIHVYIWITRDLTTNGTIINHQKYQHEMKQNEMIHNKNE